MRKKSRLVSPTHVDPTDSILLLRGQRVILDSTLAPLYGVTTKRLNEQVKRNTARFPADFMFQLTRVEAKGLMWSQIATTSQKFRREGLLPRAFTEHGAIMAATVLKSSQAIEMSVYVVRAFVHLRALLMSDASLAARLSEIEKRLGAKLITHEKAIVEILRTIRSLTGVNQTRSRPIGFTADID